MSPQDDAPRLAPTTPWWAWVLLLGVAFAVRLGSLGAEGFWFDEVMQVARAADHDLFSLWSRVPPDKPPLAFYVLWPLARVSLDEAWLRLPSLLFGVAGVGLVVLVTRAIAPARVAAAWGAGALAAFSPLAVKLSAEVLPYSAATAWVTVAYLSAIHWHRSGRRSALAWMIAATGLALWTSYQAAAALVPLGLFALVWTWLRGDRRAMAVAGAALAGALTTVPLWPRLLFESFPENNWAPAGFFSDTLPLVLGGLSAGFDGAPQNLAWTGFTTFAVLGVVARASGRRMRASWLWLASWLFAGLILLCATAYVQQHWVAVRYLLLFVPPWLAFAALGADAIAQRVTGSATAQSVVVAGLCAVLVATTLPTLEESRSARLDFRGLAKDLAERAEPGDLVLFQHRLDQVPYDFYQRRIVDGAPPAVSLQPGDPISSRARARIARAQRVWVPSIVYHWLPMTPTVREFFLQDGRESLRRGTIGARVVSPTTAQQALWGGVLPRPEEAP